jgi:hypothetical protein
VIKRTVWAIIFSTFVVLYGFGASYDRVMTPRHTVDRFQGIFPDSWIADGATIDLPHLAASGNRAQIKLGSWRPQEVGPALVKVSVCDEVRAEFVLDRDLSFPISLNGSCEPRRIQFSFANPFNASSSDQRRLGAQLQEIRVTSRLRTAIVKPLYLIVGFASMFALWLIFCRAFERLGLSWISYLVIGCGYPIFASIERFQFAREWALLSLVASLGLGVWCAEAFLRKRQERGEVVDEMPTHLAMLCISAIIALAAALRFYGLSFGLPNNYHPDEVPKVNAIMRMVSQGDLNPTYFLHPSLLLYTSYAVNQLFHMMGMEGDFRETAFLAGRTVSAVTGTASVYLIYRSGVLLFSRSAGLMAAAFLAVFPLHVTCSRYMKEDVLLTFFILLTVVVTLKAIYQNKRWLLILAGFIAGVSASTKYSGILSIVIVLGAPWLKSRSLIPDFSYLVFALLGAAVAPLGFILCTPYSVLTPEKFLKDFNSERNHMERGHTIPFDAWSQYWTYHYWRSMIPGAGWLVTVLSVLAMAAFVMRWHWPAMFVVGLILLYYLPAEWVKAKPAPQPERYILPCLPFMGLIVAALLDALRRSPIRFIVPILFLVAFVPPSVRTTQLASEVAVDTRDLMAQWMIENLPQQSTVLLDWKPYCPRFWNNEFDVVYVPRATILYNLQMERLKDSMGQYLVLSSLFYDRYFSQPNLDPSLRERFREVFYRVPIIKEIHPRYGTYGFNNPSLTLFSLKAEDIAALEQEIEAFERGERDSTSNMEKSTFPWLRLKRRGDDL